MQQYDHHNEHSAHNPSISSCTSTSLNVCIADVRSLHEADESRKGMAPLWPFGKKKQPLMLDEPEPEPIVYRKDTDSSQEVLADNSHRESVDYKAAVSLFGNGDTTVKRAEEQSQYYEGIVDAAVPNASAPQHTWIHHTDGYHYKQFSDGAFDSQPHQKNPDGTYTPYQS